MALETTERLLEAGGEKAFDEGGARRSLQGRALGDPQSSKYGFEEGFFMALIQKANTVTEWSPFPRYRDRQLRMIYPTEAMLDGTVYSFYTRMKALPYKITGGRNQKIYAQDLFESAQFGRGLPELVGLLVQDYLTQDNGAFVELVGGGNPNRPLSGRLYGLAHLDSQQCYRTQDPEYPVLYSDPLNASKFHRIHHTRVISFSSMTSPMELARGVGHCPVGRTLTWAQYVSHLMTYKLEKISGNQTRAIGYGTGYTNDQLTKAFQLAESADVDAGFARFRRIPFLTAPPGQAGGANELKLLELAGVADGFNFKEDIDLYAYVLALAFGVDVREIWAVQASGATKADATVQAMKAKGKGVGEIIQTFERLWNQVLPAGVVFSYDYVDDDQDKAEAEQHAIRISNAVQMAGRFITPEQGAELLIMQGVLPEQFAGTIGQIEAAPVSDETDDQEEVGDDTPESDAPEQPADRDEGRREFVPAEKAIQATRIDFELEVETLLAAGMASDVNRRQFGARLRTLIQRYGRAAFIDGLNDGGVEGEDLSREDEKLVAEITRSQSQYVTSLGAVVYGAGISEAQATNKPAMWFNKSIQPFYDAGRLSADANGMYEFTLGKTVKHCDDCERLDGQRHRMKDWLRTNWQPRSGKHECKGFQCDCDLIRVKGRERGQF